MSNPVFSNSDVFGEPRRTARGGATTAPPRGQAQYGAYGAQAADAASLQNMYESPSATPVDTKRLTYTDVIMKTAGLLALLVVVAAATWVIAPGLWIFGMIAGLVLGLVNAFKKNPSPVLITLYTIAQGVFLGGISAFYETQFNGIVGQAVLLTLCVFAAALGLYSSGKVRVTPKFTRFLLIGMVGYLLFSLVNVVLVWTGVLEGWGMRGGTLGIVIGLFAVVLAAMSLIMDFDFIKRGVEQGVPAKFAWSAAFGLIVTLVWLYLEILRLLAIMQSSD
ncbi:Bax inhibitor-1/YccA family protein [Isoptericola chiayiensis]|uniref:Bax inhibitor-1/YccA family protein n=1 Tax=Isoptericola chiayiensis TaxID=579446 RepID=A0ABP8Y2D4_9MICO|nr:Bax inhibitor-1/YccA family protein [Isoptericola chiayiensis]NOV99405.1 putative YccA/Bax inhibitor family protein [Isoptericola chiayiensis]